MAIAVAALTTACTSSQPEGGAATSSQPSAPVTSSTRVASTTSLQPTTTLDSAPSTVPTTAATTTTPTRPVQDPGATEQVVRLRIESRVGDVTRDEFATIALSVLNDPRGWVRAGFTFEDDDSSEYLLVLAEGPEVDALCLPLDTATKVSCQNGPVVALNADRWRVGVTHWDSDLAAYRGYLLNHEVGHLLGQRHPTPRCPVAGRPAAVMEPQTGNLRGCTGNAWPREWEIAHALQRPVVYAPLPDWAPEPVPPNLES